MCYKIDYINYEEYKLFDVLKMNHMFLSEEMFLNYLF